MQVIAKKKLKQSHKRIPFMLTNPDNQLPRNGEIVKIKLSVDANNPLAVFNSFVFVTNTGIKDEKEIIIIASAVAAKPCASNNKYRLKPSELLSKINVIANVQKAPKIQDIIINFFLGKILIIFVINGKNDSLAS